MAATQELRPVRFHFRPAHDLALNDRLMCRPDVRLPGRALAARRQNDAWPGQVLRLHEELRERRVCQVRSRRREYELGIGRDVDVVRLTAVIRNREVANLRVVLRRDDDLEGRCDAPVSADKFGSIFGERHLIGVWLHAAGLVTRRPHLAAFDVAKKDVAARIVARQVLTPARDSQGHSSGCIPNRRQSP